MAISNLKKMCMTIGNLPSSYVDSLSYYEQLTYLCHYIENTVVPALNDNIEAVDEIRAYVEEYLEDLSEVKSQIVTINSEIDTLQTNVSDNTADITRLENQLVSDISSLKAYTDDLVTDNFNTLKQYVDYQDGILDDKITNIQIGAINVYNPTNGLLQPLQVVINDLYEISNRDGLTATEFDTLQLTATAFDAYNITAREFDSEGKIILV